MSGKPLSCFWPLEVNREIKSSRKKNYLQQQLSMSCNSQFLNNGRKGKVFMLIYGITGYLIIQIKYIRYIKSLIFVLY